MGRASRYSPEVRDRAVRLVLEHEREHDSQWAAIRSTGVRKAFFVTGSALVALPEAGHRLVAAGHELGNHTCSQKRSVLESAGFVRREVEETDALIRSAGHPPASLTLRFKSDRRFSHAMLQP